MKTNRLQTTVYLLLVAGILVTGVTVLFPQAIYAEGRTVIDMTPGIEKFHIDSERLQNAAESDPSLKNIIGRAFASLGQALLEFENCDKGKCAEVPDLSAMAKWCFNLQDPDAGGYLYPQMFQEPGKFDWANKPEHEQRIQWFSNKCATNKKGPLQIAAEKIVSPNLAMTKEPQWYLNTIAVCEQINAAINGVHPGIKSFNFDAFSENFFEMVNGVPQLKKEHEPLAQDCDTESEGKPMRHKTEEIIGGTVGGGDPIEVSSSDVDALKYAANKPDYLEALAYCILHISDCVSKLIGYDLNLQVYTAEPGVPRIWSFGHGGLKESDLPPGIDAETKANLTTDRQGGNAGTVLPKSFMDASETFEYTKSHGSVGTTANVTMEQSQAVLAATSIIQKFSAVRGIYKDFVHRICAITPVSAQQREGYAAECVPDGGSQSGTPGPNPYPTSGPPQADCTFSQEQLLAAAGVAGNKYNVPPSMLKAIYTIENGGAYRVGQTYTCQDNGATAWGPNQITDLTYQDVLSSSEQLPIGYNTCEQVAGKFNRCNIYDAMELTSRVLLKKLFRSPETGIKACDLASVDFASCAYYGFDRDKDDCEDVATNNWKNRSEITRSKPTGPMTYSHIVCALMAQDNPSLSYCPTYPDVVSRTPYDYINVTPSSCSD